MNEVLTALKTRRSIRKFRSDPVPRHSLMKSWKRAFMRQAVWIVKNDHPLPHGS